MNGESEGIGEFLKSRRARLTPADVGLPEFGGRRRVPGLRREEVALLAGMSPEYYRKFERGNAHGVSESIVDSVGHALRLDEAERAHLADLVRSVSAGSHPKRQRPVARRSQVRTGVQRMIDAMTALPVLIQNGKLDVVATNTLGRELFSELFRGQAEPANAARFVFLDTRSEVFYRDWDRNARQVVALLRAEAGRWPEDRELSALIGELSTRSGQFRRLWAAHDVREHRTGLKEIHHPVVGDLTLSFEVLDLATDRALQMVVFTAEDATHASALLALEHIAAEPSQSRNSPVGDMVSGTGQSQPQQSHRR